MTRPDLRNPVMFLAFGLGSGLAPKAPGTAGSLAALPIFFLLALLPLPVFMGVMVLATVLGIWLCGRAAAIMGVHDHEGIVWDEFVGQWLTLVVLVPASTPNFAMVGWVVLGFGLFRLFDILKPWPISWVDRSVHGGFGIMLDDLLAAIPAGLILALCHHGWQVWHG
jgi:phosphatidylglycerophosphatase A